MPRTGKAELLCFIKLTVRKIRYDLGQNLANIRSLCSFLQSLKHLFLSQPPFFYPHVTQNTKCNMFFFQSKAQSNALVI